MAKEEVIDMASGNTASEGILLPGSGRGESLRESGVDSSGALPAILELPLPQALRILAGISGSRRSRRFLACADAIQAGEPAASVAARLGVEQSVLEAVTTAEQAGCGEAALKACVEVAEFDARIKRILIERFSYSFLIASAAAAALFFVSSIAIERMRKIFEGFGVELPGMTVLVMFCSGLIVDYIAVWVTGLVAITGLAAVLIASPSGRRVLREIGVWVPLFGSIVDSAARVRATAALSRMIQGNARAPLAVLMAIKLCGLSSVAKSLWRLGCCLEAGERPGDTDRDLHLLALPLFDAPNSQTAVKELRSLYELHAGRVTALSTLLPFVLEPLAVICVGMTISFVVIALFMPLVKLMNDLS